MSVNKHRVYIGEVSDNGIGGQIVYVLYEDGQLLLLPHIVKHSPDGFQWGYGGSGPADLALSILTDCFGLNSQEIQYYQDFKWTVIAELPQGKSWVLSEDFIREWMENEKKEISECTT